MMPQQALFVAACVSFTVNALFGASVKAGLVNSAPFHWVHSALYICTFVLTGAAISTVFWGGGTAGWWLLPAVVPLAALPYVRSRSWGHVALALSVAPFLALGLIVSLASP
ncbi:hypothetical protein [Subtercola sp. YIM 133946]|uniref:hypothetical protein n=1 Tax=Subtercola sp. YIM 133946 TaxID=3118909 RepID=UPI002F922A3C